MTKKWEEDFRDQILLLAKHYGVWGTTTASHANSIVDVYRESVAKQRTQLLARVREEVVGNFEVDQYHRNIFRQEQLKKLEIISEEGK